MLSRRTRPLARVEASRSEAAANCGDVEAGEQSPTSSKIRPSSNSARAITTARWPFSEEGIWRTVVRRERSPALVAASRAPAKTGKSRPFRVTINRGSMLMVVDLPWTSCAGTRHVPEAAGKFGKPALLAGSDRYSPRHKGGRGDSVSGPRPELDSRLDRLPDTHSRGVTQPPDAEGSRMPGCGRAGRFLFPPQWGRRRADKPNDA